jgi:diguanylate cyclase (GGDEF)-like protein
MMVKEELADVLSEFARTMVTDFPIQGILDHLVKRIVEVLPITAAGVTLIAPGLDPRYVAASSPAALRYEKLQTELDEGPCLAAFNSGEAVSVPDLGVEDRFPKFTPRALEAGLTAVFTFPLRHGDIQLGALDLYRDSAGPLSPESMTAAQTLADVAAAYLINAQARSDLRDSSEESRDAALHDSLTGLPNRALILQLIDHAFRSSRRSKKMSAVLFVDLDRFKEVNDTHGHQVGDELLVAVAERLTRLLRPGDSVARLSGDEFVILCEDIAGTAAVDSLAVRLDAELSRPFDLAGIEVTVSASIGIAFTGQGTKSPEELLVDADLAMYQSKRDRIDGREVIDLRQLHLAGDQAGLARGLSGAIGRNELHLEYQPIVESSDGRITGVEALLRWTHPSHGPISPAVFIPFAEQSGQIVNIGRWVLEQACVDRQRWQRRASADITMWVNVSVHQLMSAGLAQIVETALANTATDPGLVTLEVTEGVFVRDEQRALVVLDELKRIGVRLALDDFGTGYSSLGHLDTMPIDSIKVDRSFISRLTDQPGSRDIVSAIIGLAHRLGMDVIAEGVETAEQRDELTELGSDLCQGFYFAKPMTAALVQPLTRIQAGGRITRLPVPAPGARQRTKRSPRADGSQPRLSRSRPADTVGPNEPRASRSHRDDCVAAEYLDSPNKPAGGRATRVTD